MSLSLSLKTKTYNRIRHGLGGLLPCVLFVTALVCAPSANAMPDYSDGLWKTLPVYSGKVDKIIPAGETVYYISGGSLFSMKADGSESTVHDSGTGLNNTSVKDIYFDYDTQVLAVLYQDSSIDLIDSKGKVTFVPDIRDASLTNIRKARNASFFEGNMIVCLNEGFVIIGEDRGETKKFEPKGNYSHITGGGDRLWAKNWSVLCSMPKDNPSDSSISWYDKVGELADMVYIGDNTLLLAMADGTVNKVEVNTGEGKFSQSTVAGAPKTKGKFQVMKDGGWSIQSADGTGLALFNANGSYKGFVPYPSDYKINCGSSYKGADEVYVSTPEGFAAFDLSSSPTLLIQPYKADCVSSSRVAGFSISDDGERIYAYNRGYADINPGSYFETGTGIAQQLDMFENGHITNVLPEEFTLETTVGKNAQTAAGDRRLYGSPGPAIEDPDVKGRYWICNGHEGLVVVENGEHLITFNDKNTPSLPIWDMRATEVSIDPAGNLWCGFQSPDDCPSPYIVLPKEKRTGDLKSLSKTDWKFITMPDNFHGNKEMYTVFDKKSGVAMVISTWYNQLIYLIDTKGTWDDDSDDVRSHIVSFTDQDGQSCAPDRLSCAYRDERGRLWLGSTSGIFLIEDIGKQLTSPGTVKRIKVPRNDGTNYADYLLGSETITSISGDPSGRKWIGTAQSGLYLVSPEGNKIINHFTSENSALLSNQVSAVMASPKDNTVYIATVDGVQTYQSDASPARSDFSDIYAYPNPVKPDYDGDVTITGLMDNSLVKIADASGNVIYQTRSEGGMARWNCCGGDGRRVKSGVYYVFASAGGDGESSSGAVTKIMVIN